jgi:hypothetical protein
MNEYDVVQEEEEIRLNGHKCEGLYYRCRVNNFINASGHYIDQIRFVPLKRMSCDGLCKESHCHFLKDDLGERAPEGGSFLPIIKNPIDGGLYKLTVTNLSKDFESQYYDDWDLEFVLQPAEPPLKEPTTKETHKDNTTL